MKIKGKIIGTLLGLIFSGNIIGGILLGAIGHFLFDTLFETKEKNEKDYLEFDLLNNNENNNINILKNILEICIGVTEIKNNILLSEIETIKKFFKKYFKFEEEDLKELESIIKKLILRINEIDIKNSILNINQYCKYEEKLQIIHLLFACASSDMPISDKELNYIFDIAQKINIISSDYNKLKEHFITNEIDYYKILGISKEATISEIKKAYRKAVSELHPDKKSNNDYDNEKFQQIVKAYNELVKIKKNEKI